MDKKQKTLNATYKILVDILQRECIRASCERFLMKIQRGKNHARRLFLSSTKNKGLKKKKKRRKKALKPIFFFQISDPVNKVGQD